AMLPDFLARPVPDRQLLSLSRKLMQALFFSPSRADALALSAFFFSDGAAPAQGDRLAEPAGEAALRSLLLPRRAYAYLRGQPSPCHFLWPYGSIALSDTHFPGWYRLNCLAWDILRQTVFHSGLPPAGKR